MHLRIECLEVIASTGNRNKRECLSSVLFFME